MRNLGFRPIYHSPNLICHCIIEYTTLAYIGMLYVALCDVRVMSSSSNV